MGNGTFQSWSMVNRTMAMGGGSTKTGKHVRRRKGKKVRKNKGGGDEEDSGETYKKIITKTEIVVTKKKKKTQEDEYENEYEEEYYDEEYGENEEYREMHEMGVHMLYASNDVMIKHRVPKPATCTTWNGNKIKTFDGLIYNHNLHCSHTLLQDRVDGTFGVVLRACSSSYKEPCSYAIDIMLSDTKYKLENISMFCTLDFSFFFYFLIFKTKIYW